MLVDKKLYLLRMEENALEDKYCSECQKPFCAFCDTEVEDAGNAQPQWIPCSERLPEDNRQVLVYARNVHFALAKYDEMREANGIYEKQWVTFDAWKPFYKIKDVIAWMPLPEPYVGENDD